MRMSRLAPTLALAALLGLAGCSSEEGAEGVGDEGAPAQESSVSTGTGPDMTTPAPPAGTTDTTGMGGVIGTPGDTTGLGAAGAGTGGTGTGGGGTTPP